MCKARMKIQENIFKTINQQIHNNACEHIYAIDGSKIRVHDGFKKLGYKSRTCEANVPRKAKRPLAMLSSLSGVNSDTIHNYTVTKHFNERLVVPELISKLKPGDIVLLDRGYYSQNLFTHFVESKMHCVMRLKKDANSIVHRFYSSNKHCLDSNLICKTTGRLIPIRYLKYIIDNKKYIVATTLSTLSSKNAMKLYRKRWRVELHFKRLKSQLHINTIYSKTEKLWLQEIQARILYDTICRHTQITISDKITYTNIIHIIKYLISTDFVYNSTNKIINIQKHTCYSDIEHR